MWLKSGWTTHWVRPVKLRASWSQLSRPMHADSKKKLKDALFHLDEVEKTLKNAKSTLASVEIISLTDD